MCDENQRVAGVMSRPGLNEFSIFCAATFYFSKMAGDNSSRDQNPAISITQAVVAALCVRSEDVWQSHRVLGEHKPNDQFCRFPGVFQAKIAASTCGRGVYGKAAATGK